MNRDLERSAITRLESPSRGTFGWQVRLRRRGQRFAKFFADRTHGGPEPSLLAARTWRDDLIQRLAESGNTRVCNPSPRNSSGVVGVSRITIAGPNGLQYYFWQATWCPSPGQRRCVRFSIRRHGEDGAFTLAVQARNSAIQG